MLKSCMQAVILVGQLLQNKRGRTPLIKKRKRQGRSNILNACIHYWQDAKEALKRPNLHVHGIIIDKLIQHPLLHSINTKQSFYAPNCLMPKCQRSFFRLLHGNHCGEYILSSISFSVYTEQGEILSVFSWVLLFSVSTAHPLNKFFYLSMFTCPFSV